MSGGLTIPVWLPIVIIAIALAFQQGVVNVVLATGVTLLWVALWSVTRALVAEVERQGAALKALQNRRSSAQVEAIRRKRTQPSGRSRQDTGSRSTDSEAPEDGTTNRD